MDGTLGSAGTRVGLSLRLGQTVFSMASLLFIQMMEFDWCGMDKCSCLVTLHFVFPVVVVLMICAVEEIKMDVFLLQKLSSNNYGIGYPMELFTGCGRYIFHVCWMPSSDSRNYGHCHHWRLDIVDAFTCSSLFYSCRCGFPYPT